MYKIILYNKGKRVKVLKTYKYYLNALNKYNKLLNENVVFFPKETQWDGSKTDYELVITTPNKNKSKEFFRNELGAAVRVKTKGDFKIKKISLYLIEEIFTDKLNNKKIVFKDLIKKIIKQRELTHVLYVVNNKIFIEYFETNAVELYILKNCYDSYRLSQTIKKFCSTNGVHNVLFFQEPTLETKIRIYDILETDYNISRVYMHKLSTR
jgi:hypothetical protein